jgi:hypothetical protein
VATKTKDKEYSSLEALRDSDEYQEKGVLGREALIAEHFPEALPVGNQQGQRRIVGPNRTLIETPARPDQE